MKKQWKRGFACFLCAVMLISALSISVSAQPAEPLSVIEHPVRTSNHRGHGYVWNRWARPVSSYLFSNGNGYTRAEYVTDENNPAKSQIVIELYDAGLQLVAAQIITPELPIFGGIFAGKNNYFVITGQENPNEDDSCEVVRITKYDRSWNPLGHASLYGANTVVPFDAGSLRAAEFGNLLYIHTCHKMYKYDDGRNHQANLQLVVNTDTMIITDAIREVLNINFGYSSHSFNQFIIADGKDLIKADHGDAYPRSVVLTRAKDKAGASNMYYRVEVAEVLPIAGDIGDNDTGVCLGGLEATSAAYITAGISIEQKPNANFDTDVRNVFVTVTPKNNFSENGTTVNWITTKPQMETVPEGTSRVTNPHLVKIDDQKLLLLWTEEKEINRHTHQVDGLYYILLNEVGQPISELHYQKYGRLSDCKPIVSGDHVLWYVTEDSTPRFYDLSVSDLNQFQIHYDHEFTDIHGHWGRDYIRYTTARNLFIGTGEGVFSPERTMDRSMFVTVLGRLAGVDPNAYENSPFWDVPNYMWYSPYVAWAAENGITQGKSETIFEPETAVTREEMACFLMRFCKLQNIPLKTGEKIRFADEGRIQSWARESVDALTRAGLLIGNNRNCFNPQGHLTRAEAATVFARLLRDYSV